MDSKTSTEIEDYIIPGKTKIRFVEPHAHYVNVVGHAVKTYKNHPISDLCMVYPIFPLQLWNELLPQLQDTLSLLRTPRNNSNSKLSTCAALEGEYTFVKTPVLPPGTRNDLH